MKLLIDGEAFRLQTHGGVTRLFREMIPRLARDHGMDVTLVLPGRLHGDLHEELRPYSVSLPHCTFNFRPWRLCAPLKRAIDSFRHKRFWDRASGDVFMSTFFTKPTTGIPTVCLVYDMIHELYPDMFQTEEAHQVRRRKRSCILSADRVVCISQNTVRDVVRLTGVAEGKCAVVPLAGSIQERASAPPSRAFLLFVGKHIAEYKNFDLVRAAYRQHDLASRVDLKVVSPCPDSDSAGITFIQDCDDRTLAELYSTCAAFIYPSLYEGFGIPVLEALACGAPVVCSSAASLPEVGGRVVHYFDPTSAEGLCDALNKALAEGRAPEYVLRRKQHANTFSWDKAARELAAVLHEVAGQ